ncbi:MAG: polysaccharide biosynthesis tyrosine autokinase [Candidatus Limnocylindrales bacterium]
MDLLRQIAVVRRWFPVLAAGVLVAAAAAYLVSIQLPKVYEAQATLVVGQSLSAANPDYNQLLVSQQLSTTYARVATTRPILENVIKQLGLAYTSDDLAQRVQAEAQTDSTLLTITVQDADPSRAAAIANALADQLIAASPAIQGRQTDLQKSIDADLQATQDQITADQAQVETLTALPNRTAQQDVDLQTLESQLITLQSTYATLLSFSSGNASNVLSVIEPAVPPTSPVSPKVLLNTLVAALLGLLLAAAVAFTVESLDDRVKDADAVQEVAGLGTLGTIALMRSGRGQRELYRLAALLYPRSGVAEAYRTLRTNIEFASVDASIRTLLVTSSIPGEGKTVTAANLAVVFAQAGRRVLLVDADLRKPGVHLIFDLPNAHGLTTLLRSDEVGLDAIAHETEQENLRILTTGPLPPNPAELLGSQRMRTIIERLKSGNDLLIFDSPPLQVVTDSAILSSVLDATLLVIDARHTRRRSVLQGREALTKVGATVLGAVLNRLPAGHRADQADYYDGYPAKGARGTDESPKPASP